MENKRGGSGDIQEVSPRNWRYALVWHRFPHTPPYPGFCVARARIHPRTHHGSAQFAEIGRLGTTVPRRPCESKREIGGGDGRKGASHCGGGCPLGDRFGNTRDPDGGRGPERTVQPRALAGTSRCLRPQDGPRRDVGRRARRPPARLGERGGRAEDGESDGAAQPPDALAAPRSHRGTAGW